MSENIEINASFDITQELAATLEAGGTVEAELGTIYSIEANNRVLYATTATWNSQPQLIAKAGYIYLYSDWQENEQGQKIAGVKVGDGLAYLIDIPFQDGAYFEHIYNSIIHITEAEREFWNNKVRCYIDANNQLVFTTN